METIAQSVPTQSSQTVNLSIIEKDKNAREFQTDKKEGYNWRQRRQLDWTESYMFYRDKVIVNRLTQRQSVNIPLMKSGIKTLLKDIDEPPMMSFANLDNDTQKELFFNAYWKHRERENKLKIRDIVDKRQVLLFGRSFKSLNITNGQFTFEITDPQDILVSRYVDPAVLDSSRYLIHEHIYRPLSVVSRNPMYTPEGLRMLKLYLKSREGLVKMDDNLNNTFERNERMKTMGVPDVDEPKLGEPTIELNDYFKFRWDKDLNKEVIYYMVMAENGITLCEYPLYRFIGETRDRYWDTHYPKTSWGDDVERTDFWSDSVGDVLRTPNKIVNTLYSQLIENNTLRSFGMNFYDSSKQFTPQTLEPEPFGWYALPGKPSEVYSHIDIPDISDTMDKINFITQIAEKASAATSANQGQVEKQNVTLGEIQLALSNAKDRVRSMSALYTDSWEEFGLKYVKMLEAAGHMIEPTEITKKGKEGRGMFTRTISPADWASPNGYGVEIKDLTQSKDEDLEAINKLNATRPIFPNNKSFDTIYKKKILGFNNLNASEIKEVMDADIQAQQMMMNTVPGGVTPTAPAPVGAVA